MRSQAMTAPAALPAPAVRRPDPGRRILIVLTALAVPACWAVAARPPASGLDPDLVRVIRFMALLKGGFALAALAACLWRLRRPATGWRGVVYVAGPPLMALGAAGLWSLHDPGPAALGLHLGLFGVLASALTDRDFLPDRPARARGQIVS
jgi:hypothetical protein